MYADFISNYIHVQEENNVLMVGFADNKFETEKYILLQKSLLPSEQDKRDGMDEVHITYDNQSQSCYGGILKVILKENEIILTLNEKCANAIKANKQIIVTMNDKENDVGKLKAYLHKMFDKTTNVFVSYI